MKQSLPSPPDADPVHPPVQASAIVCRPLCGACCTAPSISTPIPQPDGSPPRPKAAGEPCPQLDEALRCRLFGHPSRPAVCASLRPEIEMCGSTRTHAMQHLHWLETVTAATPPMTVETVT